MKKHKREHWKYVGRTGSGLYHHWKRTDKRGKGDEHFWHVGWYRYETTGKKTR